MKMLFVHSNKFWKDHDTYYSYGSFAYGLLWKRYFRYFDEIRVGGRIYDADGTDLSQYSISSGKNVSFFALPDMATVKGILEVNKARRTLHSELQKCDFAVIRLPSTLGYIACEEARRLGKNYAVEVVGCVWDSLTNYSILGKIIAPIETICEKKYVKSAPNAIYVSRHFLQKRYPNNHFNVGCPDSNITCYDKSVLECRLAKINMMDKTKDIKIGLIASLNVGYKGHDTAIKALAYLKKKYPTLKVYFLGDGKPDRWRDLASQYGVEDRVVFCGALPGGDPVFHWLDDMDIFIMPSLQETLGRALVEAMSRACPSIGGAGTAVPEQLPDDCIHERKNAKQLAHMISYMLENKEYMKLCAEENFTRAKKYSEEILNQRRDYFWKRAIGKQTIKRGLE